LVADDLFRARQPVEPFDAHEQIGSKSRSSDLAALITATQKHFFESIGNRE
jgi:hypothetical protein